MDRQTRYPKEVRERAVRLVFEHEREYHSQWAATAMQIVVPTVGPDWFASDELQRRAVERHGVSGATCSTCGRWRWMPLTWGLLPPLRYDQGWENHDAVASPEWFGDGCKSFRQVLVRRGLAEMLAAASPRDFRVEEVE